MHPFEEVLSVSKEEITILLRSIGKIEWSDFLLNPRRLRGSDFLMRWSQGVWSEHRLIEAVNSTKKYFAVQYGPSSAAPSDDVREFELYFERLDKAGLGNIKRPDLLIYKIEYREFVDNFLNDVGGEQELPFIKEKDLRPLIEKSLTGVECENSLWVAKDMPAYGSELTPQKRLNGKLGLKKSAVLPTIIVKEEDLKPLTRWQTSNKKTIHIWHGFYDLAFGISYNKLKNLISRKLILPTEQVFQAPGGATTKKIIYKVYYHYAYPLGVSTQEPKLISAYIKDKNGHILPYVKFEGGHLKIMNEALEELERLR
ncbi:MAG: AccI family restriction endonuclease [Ignavibacteriales bacterium]|nr:AccI family restriction endonuclease [Ignavibacteriales bacterium]